MELLALTTPSSSMHLNISMKLHALYQRGRSILVQPNFILAEVTAFRQDARLDDVILRAFAVSIKRLLVSGVVEDYVERFETLTTVRGKIDIAGQLRRRPGISFPLENQFVELTADTAPNRYLLDTLLIVSRLRIAPADIRREARGLADKFRGVQSTRSAETQPHLDIRHSSYEVPVRLATIVRRALSLALGAADARAPGFIIDMNLLFESFLTKALKHAVEEGPHKLVAQGSGRDLYMDRDGEHPIKPDITLWKGDHCTAVADVKYKDVDRRGIRSEDLYQVAAYASVLGLDTAWLLYPGKDDPTELLLLHDTLRVKAVSVDITQPPSDLLAEIQQLADDLAGREVP